MINYQSSYPIDTSRNTRQTYTPAPLPGSTLGTKDGSQPNYWSATIPQYQPQTTSQAYTPSSGWSSAPGMSLTDFERDDFREQGLQYMQANLPYNQFLQNQQQYNADFGEGQRRWDQQFQYQQGLDQYNMGLTQRQQQMAEWQANQAANQWSADFNRQTANDAWNQQFTQQQLGLQRQAQDVDEMYKRGQIDLGQRNAALSELQNQQQYGMAQQQFAQQKLEQQRRYGLDVQTQAQLDAYRNAQMAQEAQLAREQLAAQQQASILSQFGRNQAPNARWVRAI